MLHINIVNYETIVKSSFSQQYVQKNDDNEHLFVDRRFRRDVSSFNRRDNSINSRENFRENFNFNSYRSRVQLDSKKCFVCEKLDCWFTNHSKSERDQFRKRFSNRVSQFKTRSGFDRRLKQYIIDYEDINDENDYINQYFEKLSIDAFFEDISTSTFMIEFTEHSQTFNESKCFLISLESLDESKTITNMLANKILRHRLIAKDSIIAFVLIVLVSISYVFNVFIESRYDDREFKNLLIDHDAAIWSSEDIEQYTILKRLINDIELNRNNVSKFKFDIDSNSFIDSINLNISIDRVVFYIILVDISFLLYLIDLNRLDVYFNNLINMLIENRYNIDLQIDMKNDSQKADILHIDMKKDLQIDLKKDRTNVFHIDMKKDHHSIIRRYDHVFVLWKIFIQSYIIESLDQNFCMLIEIELRRLHHRFEHFSTRRL